MQKERQAEAAAANAEHRAEQRSKADDKTRMKVRMPLSHSVEVVSTTSYLPSANASASRLRLLQALCAWLCDRV